MNFKKWYYSSTPQEKKDVAAKAGTQVDYLIQLAGGHRSPGVDLCKRLVKASKKVTPNRQMDLASLRPDIWGDV